MNVFGFVLSVSFAVMAPEAADPTPVEDAAPDEVEAIAPDGLFDDPIDAPIPAPDADVGAPATPPSTFDHGEHRAVVGVVAGALVAAVIPVVGLTALVVAYGAASINRASPFVLPAVGVLVGSLLVGSPLTATLVGGAAGGAALWGGGWLAGTAALAASVPGVVVGFAGSGAMVFGLMLTLVTIILHNSYSLGVIGQVHPAFAGLMIAGTGAAAWLIAPGLTGAGAVAGAALGDIGQSALSEVIDGRGE